MDAARALHGYLQYTLGQLIEHPEEASIQSEARESGELVFRVRLQKDDLARVIGRNGYTIRAIRNVLNAGASKLGVEVVLKVAEG